VVSELQQRGHSVVVYEPLDGWSLTHLRRGHGDQALVGFRAIYPGLESRFYDLATLDPDRVTDGADLVIVHEWNEHELVARIGHHHAACGRYTLLFHDTHHRSVTDRESLARYRLRHYDGVLAFGAAICRIYQDTGWSRCAWVWHEAADIRVFHPLPAPEKQGDLVWVGNWGDGERDQELREFLLDPVQPLGLRAAVYGVRYPEPARAALRQAGIGYHGWLPNFQVPAVFARHRVTVHVPRRPYVECLPGIPTIRIFEALACGIPLVCAPWEDAEGLFTPGKDYRVARDGKEMQRHLRALLADSAMAAELAAHGLRTILRRHTCAQRVDELLAIYRRLNGSQPGEKTA
jgi:spore maturation protein CgeB